MRENASPKNDEKRKVTKNNNKNEVHAYHIQNVEILKENRKVIFKDNKCAFDHNRVQGLPAYYCIN